MGCQSISIGYVNNREGIDWQRLYLFTIFLSHRSKLLVVIFPNGMIGSVYISSLQENNNEVINMSGLNQ